MMKEPCFVEAIRAACASQRGYSGAMIYRIHLIGDQIGPIQDCNDVIRDRTDVIAAGIVPINSASLPVISGSNASADYTVASIRLIEAPVWSD